MKNAVRIFSAIILFNLIAAGFLAAQTGAKKTDKITAEITNLRRETTAANERRERRALEEFYAENFSHTHATGKVDDRQTRLDVLISGDKTIETAQSEEVVIKIFGKQTAVAAGKSAIQSDDGTISKYRWLVVYAKIGKKWRIAGSQAVKLNE